MYTLLRTNKNYTYTYGLVYKFKIFVYNRTYFCYKNNIINKTYRKIKIDGNNNNNNNNINKLEAYNKIFEISSLTKLI